VEHVFSGTAAPVGETPWMTATIDDGDSSGSLTLTLACTNLTANEFVSEWSLNLDPALDPAALTFTEVNRVGAFNSPNINRGRDIYKAAGDGYFDIEFAFATAKQDRFGPGESVTFTVSGIADLRADSFDFLSSGSSKGYPTATHIQGIGSESLSAWATAPEPATLVLLIGGGATVLLRRRRQP